MQGFFTKDTMSTFQPIYLSKIGKKNYLSTPPPTTKSHALYIKGSALNCKDLYNSNIKNHCLESYYICMC